MNLWNLEPGELILKVKSRNEELLLEIFHNYFFPTVNFPEAITSSLLVLLQLSKLFIKLK